MKCQLWGVQNKNLKGVIYICFFQTELDLQLVWLWDTSYERLYTLLHFLGCIRSCSRHLNIKIFFYTCWFLPDQGRFLPHLLSFRWSLMHLFFQVFQSWLISMLERNQTFKIPTWRISNIFFFNDWSGFVGTKKCLSLPCQVIEYL